MTEDLLAKIHSFRNDPTGRTFWSQTYGGGAFYYTEEKLDGNPYTIEDISHHLATINRYGGAAIYPYSVAQHSIALAHAVWEETHDPVLALDALIHDAEEAYVGDMRLPMKDRCPEFRLMCEPIDAALRRALRNTGIPVPAKETDIVKVLDRRIVANERPFVMRPAQQPWYGMEGFEPIPNLPAELFEETGWRVVRLRYRKLLETFTSIAKMAEAI